MESCEQAPNLNMLQHGQSVHKHFKLLLEELSSNTVKHKELFAVWDKYKSSIPPAEVLEQYHVYHDCGKHLCLEIGEDGKRQFPNHAHVSSEQYLKVFSEDKFSAMLIAKDMDFHILKGDDLIALCNNPVAPILYLTAWAEINANAEMFGGTDSDSYKIKRSRLIQAGKKLLNKGN
jgi:hypothetical protein